MHVPPPLRALLRGAIDYAGLFPPASLALPEAAAQYAAYLDSDDRWALGRFVVPAARLEELVRARGGHPAGEPWRLSVLAGADVDDGARRVAALAAAPPSAALRVEAVEARVTTKEELRRLRVAFEGVPEIFCEVAAEPDPRPLVAAIGRAGMRAKLRTGGVTPDAIPSAAQVACFLAACAAEGVACKLTAGLHHPLRAEHPLTYAADAPRGTMHGYLNVFLAAALLGDGGTEREATELLEERAATAFEVDAAGIGWRSRRISTASIERARQRAALAFGSCSFREPLDDLAAIPSLADAPS